MPAKMETPLLSPVRPGAAVRERDPRHPATQGGGGTLISHLMAVSASVLEYGGNETEAIAALLHDAAEDCGGQPMLETVRVMLGMALPRYMKACTDTMEGESPPGAQRKEAYLTTWPARHLRSSWWPVRPRLATSRRLSRI